MNHILTFVCSRIKRSSQDQFQLICSFKLPEGCEKVIDHGHDQTPSTTEKPTSLLPETGVKCTAPNQTHNIEYWPPAYPGQYSIAQCPQNHSGEAKWFCEKDGHFSKSGPNIACTRFWLKPILSDLENTTDPGEFVRKTTKFDSEIEHNPIQYEQELIQMIDVVKTIQLKSNHMANELSPSQMTQVSSSVLSSCSKILENKPVWKASSKTNRVQLAEKVLEYVQFMGVDYGCHQAKHNHSTGQMKRSQLFSQQSPNIFMNAFLLDIKQRIHFEYKRIDFAFNRELSNSTLNGSRFSSSCEHSIGIGSVFLNLATELAADSETESSTKQINSDIVAFSYNNHTIGSIQLPPDTWAQMT